VELAEGGGQGRVTELTPDRRSTRSVLGLQSLYLMAALDCLSVAERNKGRPELSFRKLVILWPRVAVIFKQRRRPSLAQLLRYAWV
jgi:hypothetical protein